MIRNDTDGHIRRLPLSISYPCDPAYMLAEGKYRIYIEHGIYALHYARQTLKAHARIDVLHIQLGIIVMPVIVELREYVVPDLHIPVAVAAYRTAFPVAAVLFPTVIVHFRARPTGACSMLPEIIFFPKAEDPLRRDPNVFVPDLPRFVVLQIDRRVQPVRRKADHFRQELPRPADRLFLKIIPE